MFEDEVSLSVKAGDGGKGGTTFHHEKHNPKGGPDGGDGGNGGDIILKVDDQMTTFYDYAYEKEVKAEDGEKGKGNNKHGKTGKNKVIPVPPGTVVYDKENGRKIADLKNGEIVVAKGGEGGKGNTQFATPTNQTPRYSEEGEEGEKRKLLLKLKLIANIGIVGLPNVGKSTLLKKYTGAQPKTASYPFTTIRPHLGILEGDMGEKLILADIPGLIEDSSDGKGLGTDFLKHIERTSILLIVLDITSESVIEDYELLRDEILEYAQSLWDKPKILALNKEDEADFSHIQGNITKIKDSLDDKEFHLVSATTGEGLDNLKKALLERTKEVEETKEKEKDVDFLV